MQAARYITALCSAGLTFLAEGFVLGQYTAPTDYHLVSEDVLATIDLVKEIDSVQNRELRLSRAVVLPGPTSAVLGDAVAGDRRNAGVATTPLALWC